MTKAEQAPIGLLKTQISYTIEIQMQTFVSMLKSFAQHHAKSLFTRPRRPETLRKSQRLQCRKSRRLQFVVVADFRFVFIHSGNSPGM